MTLEEVKNLRPGALLRCGGFYVVTQYDENGIQVLDINRSVPAFWIEFLPDEFDTDEDQDQKRRWDLVRRVA